MANNDQYTFKILSLGESSVGKSCLIHRYINDKFETSQLSTVGIDFKTKTINVNSTSVNLKIWDTAGQERFRNLTQQYYKNADGIILMFDVTSKASFETIGYWMEQIKTFAHIETTPVILVGTKIDLNESREVSKEEAEELAQQLSLVYFETSAKENINIDDAFKELCNLIYAIKSQFAPDQGRKQTVMIDPKKARKDKDDQEKKKTCCDK